MINPLHSRILEELSYTDLDTHRLAHRLGSKIRVLTTALKELEKEGKIKRTMHGDQEMWEAT